MQGEESNTSEKSLATDDTELSPIERPDLLGGVQAEQQRAAVHTALFGGGEQGSRLGRFRLFDRLGAGGMGTVYAAYDEQLDRKIAIKLIHPRRQDPDLRARTLREARALARLSHPNVVHVYDVGEIDEQLFIAMEFLAGPTLRAWMDAEARPWREALAVFCQAGEGLAAAHASGMIHRDFKPHNAMFGAEGRVRVLDFGLARFDAVAGNSDASSSSPAQTEIALTMTGAVMGTPAYMAPEQIGGRDVSALSDQFGFCVALYEALYGVRPFAGRTFAELCEALTKGVISPRPRDTEVPRWVHAVLLRGLALEPDQRHPSMSELLAALHRDPSRVRRRRLSLGLVSMIVVTGSVLAWRYAAEPAAERCLDARETIAVVWNEERALELREHLLAEHGERALEVMAIVKPGLDRYADDWAQMRNEACQTHASGHQSDHVFDRRTACLDSAFRSLVLFLQSVERADSGELDQILEDKLTALPRTSHCADTEALLEGPSDEVEDGQWVEHEVIRTETLASIARRYGASESSIASENKLDPDDPLDPGRKLRVRASRVPLPLQRLFYTTEDGDTWDTIAARYGVSNTTLHAFNPSLPDELWPDLQVLVMIIPEPPEPRLDLDIEVVYPLGYEQAKSLPGSPSGGALINGVQLPENDALYLRNNPYVMWANGVVAKYLPEAVVELRTRYGFTGSLVISDISLQGGGTFQPHAKHDCGRDVDIWLPMLRGVFDPDRIALGQRPLPYQDEVDWFGLYGLLAALRHTGKVDFVLLQWEQQAKVHAAGKLMGASDEELRGLLTWPQPKNTDAAASNALVRHSTIYIGQIHVRFASEL
jgi:predicted Ser/Thr protein kinase